MSPIPSNQAGATPTVAWEVGDSAAIPTDRAGVTLAIVSTPTRADAKRLAKVFAEEHNVSAVLLFGSVARGDAGPKSDIDLVAVYDDLGDYTGRFERWKTLRTVGCERSGHKVDVLVTDRPEWKHRVELVRNSFEHGIADEVETLFDEPNGSIDWGKEIGMPNTEQQVTAGKLNDISDELRELALNYLPDPFEVDAEAASDHEGLDSCRRRRLKKVCAHGAMSIEHGLKAIIVMSGNPFKQTHSAAVLILQIPESKRALCAVVPQALLNETSAWRQAGTYEAVLETMDLSTEGLYERAVSYCDAAIRLSANILNEYNNAYPVPGRAAVDLSAYHQRLEALRTTFDLWSGTKS